MSNKIKSVKKSMRGQINPLYHTTIGSLVTTVAMVTGKSEIQSLKYYNLLKKNKQLLEGKTFKELAEYVFTTFGDESVEEQWKGSLVIVFDDFRSPLFTLSDGETILPLRPDGMYTGVLLEAVKDEEEVKTAFGIEFIFDEEGVEENE